MRILVLSDSHRLKANLFEACEKHMSTVDLFIFLGDGEDDFDDFISAYPHAKYERVAGNCDYGSFYPTSLQFTAGGKSIFITHGHPYYVKHGYDMIIGEAQNRGADIVLFGHTHTQYTDYKDGLYIMNPGSVGFNREYGIIDITDKGDVMMIEEHL